MMPKRYKPDELKHLRRLLNPALDEFFDSYAVIGRVAGTEQFVIWARTAGTDDLKWLMETLRQELEKR